MAFSRAAGTSTDILFWIHLACSPHHCTVSSKQKFFFFSFFKVMDEHDGVSAQRSSGSSSYSLRNIDQSIHPNVHPWVHTLKMSIQPFVQFNCNLIATQPQCLFHLCVGSNVRLASNRKEDKRKKDERKWKEF